MLLPIQLRVVPNPYSGGIAALDPLGRATAALPKFRSPGLFVGATVDAGSSDGRRRYVFDISPTSLQCQGIAAFAYYRQALRDGVILPADEATAKIAGRPVATMDDLCAARDIAATVFEGAYGRTAMCASDEIPNTIQPGR